VDPDDGEARARPLGPAALVVDPGLEVVVRVDLDRSGGRWHTLDKEHRPPELDHVARIHIHGLSGLEPAATDPRAIGAS